MARRQNFADNLKIVQGRKDEQHFTSGFSAASSIKINLIPLNQIQAFDQIRGVPLDQLEVSEIAENILRHGLIEPIHLALIKDTSDFGIICGHRRFRAHQVLFEQYSKSAYGSGNETRAKLLASKGQMFSSIKAQIHLDLTFGDPDSEQKIFDMQFIENLQRSNLSALQEAAGVFKYHSEYELTMEEISARISKPISTVNDSIQIARLRPTLINALQSISERSEKGYRDRDAISERSEIHQRLNNLNRSALLRLHRYRDHPQFDKLLLKATSGASARDLDRHARASGAAAKRKHDKLETEVREIFDDTKRRVAKLTQKRPPLSDPDAAKRYRELVSKELESLLIEFGKIWNEGPLDFTLSIVPQKRTVQTSTVTVELPSSEEEEDKENIYIFSSSFISWAEEKQFPISLLEEESSNYLDSLVEKNKPLPQNQSSYIAGLKRWITTGTKNGWIDIPASAPTPSASCAICDGSGWLPHPNGDRHAVIVCKCLKSGGST